MPSRVEMFLKFWSRSKAPSAERRFLKVSWMRWMVFDSISDF
jgi:hypothetical protein